MLPSQQEEGQNKSNEEMKKAGSKKKGDQNGEKARKTNQDRQNEMTRKVKILGRYASRGSIRLAGDVGSEPKD
jgi:hypothetical protein